MKKKLISLILTLIQLSVDFSIVAASISLVIAIILVASTPFTGFAHELLTTTAGGVWSSKQSRRPYWSSSPSLCLSASIAFCAISIAASTSLIKTWWPFGKFYGRH